MRHSEFATDDAASTAIRPQGNTNMARKVLIVEDDASVCQALTDILVFIGFEVRAVRTAREALTALDDRDIAVIDLNLPDAVGTVVLHKIRSEGRAIRTVIWTADPDAFAPVSLGYQPDALFHKSDIDALIAWLGHP
jgi:DNA-binding NarL/FixJ family response regulator